VHTGNFGFGNVPLSARQHTHDIRQAKTRPLPEEPAERVVGKISQTDIRLARRFSHASLPARNCHRGYAQLAAEVCLAQLTTLTDAFNFERPFWKGNFGFARSSQG
jgi:hypothetical protein